MANWYVGSTKWSAITVWAANTAYNVGDIRRQTASLGTLTVGSERAFRCTTAGTSGASEPSPWTLTEGGTPNDNAVVWTEVTGIETYGWGAAHARLANAFAWGAAGDVFWISDNHAETQAVSMTLTSSGTAAAPCKVLCVDDSDELPTALATTATITNTNNILFVGFMYIEGINFIINTANNYSFSFAATTVETYQYIKNCTLNMGTGSTSVVTVDSQGGSSSVGQKGRTVIFDNVKIRFDHTGQGVQLGGSRFEWINTPDAIDTDGSIPTSLFLGKGSNYMAVMQGKVHGVDLSALGSEKNLVNSTSTYVCGDVYFGNCVLGSGVSVLSGATPGQGGVNVFLDQCMSGDPSSGPFSAAYTYQGSVKTDTAVYRTGGASDGTAYSLKMTTNTTGVSFISPLVTRPIMMAADTAGSAITVTAHIAMEEGATPLQEGNCWMEVEYMGTAGSVLTSFIDDNGDATVLTADTTDQETSTETWTGFTGTPVKQKLACTFTPAEKGYYMVRIYLARPAAATTGPPVYVCPKLVVS